MPDFFQTLLQHINDSRVEVLEKKSIELDASPVEPVASQIADMEQDRRRDVQQDLVPFTRGLVTTFQRKRTNQPVTALHQNIPEENAVADALIEYLVRPDLASVVTEGEGPNNYVYYIEVNWAALSAVANEVGLNLEQNLEQAATTPPPKTIQ